MRQIAHPLPASIPRCKAGHHPQLVETHGAPLRAAIGTPVPVTWHIECHQCGVATVPSESRARTETRWRDAAGTFRIPLSRLGHAREQALAALNPAARAA